MAARSIFGKTCAHTDSLRLKMIDIQQTIIEQKWCKYNLVLKLIRWLKSEPHTIYNNTHNTMTPNIS